MPATMEHTKIEPLQGVTVDPDLSVITVTVSISPGTKPGTYQHHVSAISAPGLTGSTWTVIWNLAPSAGLSAAFNGVGIIIPMPGTSMPDGVDNTDRLGSSPTQRQFVFTNNVLDMNVVHYDLDLDVRDRDGIVHTRDNVVIDPTITVVKEPVDG